MNVKNIDYNKKEKIHIAVSTESIGKMLWYI